MAVFAFDDLLEAKQWALDTQKGRRNLDKWELGKIALKLRPEIEARAKANQGARTDLSGNIAGRFRTCGHPQKIGCIRWPRRAHDGQGDADRRTRPRRREGGPG